jgi:hypothetical protein
MVSKPPFAARGILVGFSEKVDEQLYELGLASKKALGDTILPMFPHYYDVH